MPIYLYKNPKTGEIKEIAQGANDTHEYEENGVKWDREFTVPQTNVNVRIDPYNADSFVERSRKYKTVGDLWDASKEAHLKRKDKDGKDFIKEKAVIKYQQKCKGKRHPLANREIK